jgi:hypothetical protein
LVRQEIGHRTLIDNQVPIGDITQEDPDGNGVIEGPFSPLASLVNPVWHISVGGAGAPTYYSAQETPWNEYWNDRPAEDGFYHSSQEHTSVFTVTEDGLKLEIYSIYGELIDRVDNLMAVK